MKVTVQSVNIPGMSTIGYGVGEDEEGNTVHFAGDHRPMRDLINVPVDDWPPVVDIEDWQILAVVPNVL